jgi:hypothetical protein
VFGGNGPKNVQSEAKKRLTRTNATDASAGAVICRVLDGYEQPITFSSKTAERNYGQRGKRRNWVLSMVCVNFINTYMEDLFWSLIISH